MTESQVYPDFGVKLQVPKIDKYTRKYLARSERAKLAYALGMTESQVKVGAQFF